MTTRYRFVPARQPDAEQVCLLDAEGAKRRMQPADALLAEAHSQQVRPDGAEFRFPAKDDTWDRMTTFIEEEGECCRFFAFEQWQEGDELVLRILRPQEASE